MDIVDRKSNGQIQFVKDYQFYVTHLLLKIQFYRFQKLTIFPSSNEN